MYINTFKTGINKKNIYLSVHNTCKKSEILHHELGVGNKIKQKQETYYNYINNMKDEYLRQICLICLCIVRLL